MKMHLIRAFLIIVFASAAALAQPSITAVQNAASYIPAGLPNSGIAQGSMFVIKGSGLGPANVAIATSFPFQTTMQGTSVQVSAGGRTVPCYIYYTLATQIAAVLPSSTPAGTGTVTVTYNGQTSAAAPITVVPNNFGMFTISQNGSGDAVAFRNGTTLLSPTAAANPGDVVVFWGTGLGPVTDDEANAAKGTDMTNVPLEVYVGGKTARILFRGRNACCSSVDTVYVEVPQGVAGCVTPVTMKIGNIVSNTATIPVAANGRVCTATASPGTDLSQLFGKDVLTFGGVSLVHMVSVTPPISVAGVTIPGQTTRNDFGGGTFFRTRVTPGGAGLSSTFDVASFGSCTVVTQTAATSGTTMPGQPEWLDAGNALSVTGPNGTKSLPKSTLGPPVYAATLDSTGNYLTSGQYTVTGPGGANVGAFTVRLSLPEQLVWTNQSTTTTVNRANGVTLNWEGGDPAGYVQISGGNSVASSTGTGAGASFTCTARAADKTFTVPAVVLLALPASQATSGVTIPGSLSIASYGAAVPFQANGIDFGGATAASISANAVPYQ